MERPPASGRTLQDSDIYIIYIYIIIIILKGEPMPSSWEEEPHACARNPMDFMPARVGRHGGGARSWGDRGRGVGRGIDWPAVKERVDLGAVATELLGAPRRTGGSGRMWWVCPFHNDHKPSFCVTPSRSEWRCFGCGAHGDAASLLMQWNGITFPEAVRVLADRVGWSPRWHAAPPRGEPVATQRSPASRLLADEDRRPPPPPRPPPLPPP